MTEFIKPQHIHADPEDMAGNQGLGRYLFLTGSDERAREISTRFNQTTINKHPRQHNLYLGTLADKNNNSIDVGAISIGMGGPSADIIINELVMVGARRLLRVGTAASLQSEHVKIGDLVIATAAVRDDKASWDYIYREYPAIASYEYITAAGRATRNQENIHLGIIHSKSSLFAREYNYSFMADEQQYMAAMKSAGVLATEMECAQLFTLASLLSSRLHISFPSKKAILAGAILAIIGDDQRSFISDGQQVQKTIRQAIDLSIATTLELHDIDTGSKALFI